MMTGLGSPVARPEEHRTVEIAIPLFDGLTALDAVEVGPSGEQRRAQGIAADLEAVAANRGRMPVRAEHEHR
jgi:hypothetical protein